MIEDLLWIEGITPESQNYHEIVTANGQKLVIQRVHAAVADRIEAEAIAEFSLKGSSIETAISLQY